MGYEEAQPHKLCPYNGGRGGGEGWFSFWQEGPIGGAEFPRVWHRGFWQRVLKWESWGTLEPGFWCYYEMETQVSKWVVELKGLFFFPQHIQFSTFPPLVLHFSYLSPHPFLFFPSSSIPMPLSTPSSNFELDFFNRKGLKMKCFLLLFWLT